MSKLSQFPRLSAPLSLSPHSSLLCDSALFPIKATVAILYHRDNLSCVWMSVCATVFVVAASLLLVAYLVASAIHLELKTNTLMKMTQTTRPFLSGFVSFFFPPKTISAAFSFLFLVSFSFWEITGVTNRDFHCIVYVHIPCLFKRIYLHSTWTKFQTPATSPQLNFTLFKHTLSAASAMSPICTKPPLKTQIYLSVFVAHLCLIFVGLTSGNFRG